MAEYSNIAWTDHTFNPWIGCTKVSPACDRCYAAEFAKRHEPKVIWGSPGFKAVHRRTSPENWKKPLSWNRKAKSPAFGERRPRVFCASLADVFDNDADPEWRKDLWDLIGATPALDWLLLTKRPQNIVKMLPADWGAEGWSNVWLGTTVENQAEAERRIPALLDNPAPAHFLSCEPLLGPVRIDDIGRGAEVIKPLVGITWRASPEGMRVVKSGGAKIDWVIIGGESGHGFRPMSMDWVAALRVQCRDAKVPVFFKQDSSIKPGSKGRASPELWNCKQFPTPTPPLIPPPVPDSK